MKKIIVYLLFIFGFAYFAQSLYTSCDVDNLRLNTVNYYPLDENGATPYVDLTNTLNFTGGTVPDRTVGMINYSQNFEDTASEFINTTNSNDLKLTSPFFVSLWFRSLEGGEGDTLISTFRRIGGAGTDAYGWLIQKNTDNKIIFSVYGGNGGNSDKWQTEAISVSSWYHLVCVYTTTDQRCYINSTQNGSQVENLITDVDWMTNHNLDIGKGKPPFDSQYFSGDVDEVLIGNYNISQDCIDFLFADGNPDDEQQYPFIFPKLNLTILYPTNLSIIWEYNGTIVINLTNVWNVTTCLLNDTGWNVLNTVGNTTIDYCYQETTNESDVDDGNCGLKYTGSYNNNSLWDTGAGTYENCFDGEWNSVCYALAGGNTAELNITYRKPDRATKESLWLVKHGQAAVSWTEANYTIPASCWNYNTDYLYFKFVSISGATNDIYGYCYDGDWVVIWKRENNNPFLYQAEEAMNWFVLNEGIVNIQNNDTPMIRNITLVYNCSNDRDEIVGDLTFYRGDIWNNIYKGDNFQPNWTNFSYTSMYDFDVDYLFMNETCILINGSNVSSFDGTYCYNLTSLYLDDVVLYVGATPLDCYMEMNSDGNLIDVYYQWINSTLDSVQEGSIVCEHDTLCTVDTLSSSLTKDGDNYSCNVNITEEWFYFYNSTPQMPTYNIGVCDAVNNITLINISYHDELTGELINASNTVDLQFYDGYGYYNYSVELTSNTSHQLCTNYDAGTVNLNMFGEMIVSSDSYITRVFSIPEATGIFVSTNPVTNQSLYMISISNSTTITYSWTTTNYQRIDGTMVIYRCEDDGSRTLIESTPITDGTATANLQLYTTAYSYAVVIDGVTYTDQSFYQCHVESLTTRSFTVDVTDVDVLPVIGLYLIDCHLYELSENVVKMEWDANDEDATDITACIIGWRGDIYGKSRIYESCVNQTSGSMTRNIGSTGFNYYVTGELTQNGVKGYCKEEVIFSQRSNTSERMGVTGVFMAAVLIIALALLASGDNHLVIFLSIIAVLVIWVIGIVSFNWVIISSIIITGILLALIGRYTLKGVS